MKIPDQEHWAIITTSQTYVPGDERSRTNPGHGYPEYYMETINYESFTNFDQFTERVTTLTRRNISFNAVQVKPMTVETTVKVKLL